jgi:uncharacterized membrane protein YfcA
MIHIFFVGFLAFFSEYLDSALGMGYGTALAPCLILLGYDPVIVVPAILISQLMTDVATCLLHHRFSNVNLRRNSPDFRIAMTLGSVSILGVIVSAFTALHIPAWFLKLYIGLLVCAVGVLILFQNNKIFPFSWKKIMGIGFVAAFNKGISGGGYGPLLMGGQILSGVNIKNAVGITAFAEAITCLAGFLIYCFLGKTIDWRLIILLVIFAVPAVPFAAVTVKKTRTVTLKKYAGVLIALLGLLTLTK